jgi:hypothetical protein
MGDDYGGFVKRRTVLKLPLALAAGAALMKLPTAAAADTPRWPVDRANSWYQQQGWLVGCNYIPSNAVNQFEMWSAGTYDPRRIDSELNACRLIGFNTVRVFLHDQLWAQDRLGFQRRLDQFVAIAASRRIKPLFVFFDSCWDPFPKIGPQRAPTPGVHNSAWVQSPGAQRIDNAQYRRVLYDYVTGVMGQFRNDPRVLAWDLWNEPDNPAPQYKNVERKDKLDQVQGLLPQVFQWARTVNAVQPLTSGVWQGKRGDWTDPAKRAAIPGIQLDNSDIITFHNYGKPEDFEACIDELAPMQRPMLCTEYLARPEGSTIEGCLPIAKRRNVGMYNWGLVAGKTQTYLPWDSWQKPYTQAPPLWFHDLLLPDGRPYKPNEIQAIRDLTGTVTPA